jgi:3-oxoacyl-[acyl-carrier-protein] synthase II
MPVKASQIERDRVVITGMGWVTPLGCDIESAWRAMLSGHSGVSSTTLFDASSFPTQFSAEVKGYDLCVDLPHLKRDVPIARHTEFLLGATAQAWQQAWNGHRPNIAPDRIGIYLANGEGALDFDAFTRNCLSAWDAKSNAIDMQRWSAAALKTFDADCEIEQEPSAALAHVAKLTGARGPSFNTITACAASTQAIGEASEILRSGDADVMLAGGASSMIHPLGVTGFNRLTTLSLKNDAPTTASRPFDAKRDGFVMGEGAGMVILETLSHAKARGAQIFAELIGYGSSSDAYRITDQHPSSLGCIQAMREAVSNARIVPEQVDYVSAHGTGTRENDLHETEALHAVFGAHVKRLPISSIKSMIGHLITAAGVVEFISCLLAIRDQILPPTINLEFPDARCDLDYVPNAARRAKIEIALSNNLGFGGQNDALVVRRYRDSNDPQPGGKLGQ